MPPGVPVALLKASQSWALEEFKEEMAIREARKIMVFIFSFAYDNILIECLGLNRFGIFWLFFLGN